MNRDMITRDLRQHNRLHVLIFAANVLRAGKRNEVCKASTRYKAQKQIHPFKDAVGEPTWQR